MAKKQKKTAVRTDLVLKFMGDGIWEIALGLVVIWAGVLTILQWSILWLLPAVIFFVVGYYLKKKYVFPRAKKIQFQRGKKNAAVELLILTLVVLIGLLSLLKKEPGLPGYWHYIQQNALIMATIISPLICFFIAFMTKSPQFYLHGILLFLTFFLDASYFKEHPIGLAIGAGIAMTASGGVNLHRFLSIRKK